MALVVSSTDQNVDWDKVAMVSLSAVSRQSHNDHEVRGFIIYDALYAWPRGERRYPHTHWLLERTTTIACDVCE